MNKGKILQRVKTALVAFSQTERSLLNVNASERSISHKLAEHLQTQFPSFNVDCEYNRHSNDIKRLEYYRPKTIKVDSLEAKTIFPDIVVHERGNDKKNLLVTEIKKSNSRQDHTPDFEKLKAFTGSQYGYKVGLFLLFDVERGGLSQIRYFE